LDHHRTLRAVCVSREQCGWSGMLWLWSSEQQWASDRAFPFECIACSRCSVFYFILFYFF
jgi:hypothetical protein